MRFVRFTVRTINSGIGFLEIDTGIGIGVNECLRYSRYLEQVKPQPLSHTDDALGLPIEEIILLL